MTHVKRFLWLAAWGVWLWLGVGLYHVLPQTYGRPLGTLPIGTRETPLGFLPAGDEFAVLRPGDGDAAAVLVYSVPSGTVHRRIEGPAEAFFFPGRNYGDHGRAEHDAQAGVRRHGLLLTNAAPGGNEADFGLHALDLVTGRWRRLAAEPADFTILHDAHPWVLFGERIAPGYPSRKLRVVEARRGAELFAHPTRIWNTHVQAAFFLPGADRLALLLRTAEREYDRTGPGSVVVWSLGGAPRVERTVSPAHLGDTRPVASPSGRAAFGDPVPTDPVIEVIDLADGRLVGRFPGRNANDGGPGATASPPCALAADGGTVLGGKPASLWEVNTGRLLWRGCDFELAWADVAAGEFAVFERWTWRLSRALRQGGRFETYATVAWRSLSDGALRRRTWADQFLAPELLSGDRSLGVTTGGVLYRAASHVDWPLLALCQAVLALPLVGLWSGLRWRRRRRASGGIRPPRGE